MKYLAIAAALLLSGCAASTPIDHSAQTEFTFDMAAPGHSKADNWRVARDYFASTYGDSRAVFSVQDPDDGTMLGKGLAAWDVGVGDRCYAQYEVQFAAKDDKARLRFNLVYSEMTGTTPHCAMWSRPSQAGYRQIVQSFQSMADGMKSALNGGNANSLKDF